MLAKKYRLPVQTVIGKKGKDMRFPNFLIKIFSSSNIYSRFGVVLKKGTVKKASDRNRIRRAIFDAIRIRQKDFEFPNADFLIIAGSSVSSLPVSEIKKEISGTFDVIINKNSHRSY